MRVLTDHDKRARESSYECILRHSTTNLQYQSEKFPTVEYFFYGDTRSTKSSMRTTLLCYGSGIQRTAQCLYADYAYQRCHDYMARNVRHSFKAAVTCVRATKRPNSTTRTTRSMFTRTSLLRTRSYGLTLRFYAKIIKLRVT